MSVPIRFRVEAVSDLLDAKAWYDERRTSLGDDFVEALERVIDLISELPSAFPEISAHLRRALLGRFPFAVYYRFDGEAVEVIACLHTRSSPSRWRGRG